MWEYAHVEDANIKKVVEKLNELGEQGWEVCGYSQVVAGWKMNTHLVLLKRQK